MQAYLNNPELKQQVIAGLQAHYEADEIIKGTYWQNGKGCAVGCILHDLNPGKSPEMYARFEIELGIPQIVARLIDKIFEGLPNEEAKEFPLKYMSAIPVGTDLSLVWPHLAIFLLDEAERFHKTDENRSTGLAVKSIYNQILKGEPLSIKEISIITARARIISNSMASIISKYIDSIDSYGDRVSAAYTARAAAEMAIAADGNAYDYCDKYYNDLAYDDAAAYGASSVGVFSNAYVTHIFSNDGREKFYSKITDKFIDIMEKI